MIAPTDVRRTRYFPVTSRMSGKGLYTAMASPPVECMRRPIVNNSRPGQAIYDPFLGSGTSLIAAEMTGRICYGVELHPAYVDVAVKRWQIFTGRAAMHQSSGQLFDERAQRPDHDQSGTAHG